MQSAIGADTRGNGEHHVRRSARHGGFGCSRHQRAGPRDVGGGNDDHEEDYDELLEDEVLIHFDDYNEVKG